MNVQNLPKTIYRIDDYGSPESGITYFSFIEPDSDTNPGALPVIEMDAAETIGNEVDYYSTHSTHIDIPHKQLLELMGELYSV